MTRQTVPDLDMIKFTLEEIPDLFRESKIKINYSYQRGDIWKPNQKIELIRSIFNSFSIGILVSFINDDKQHEILDGQQRLLTIAQYLDDRLDLSKTDITLYSELSRQEKTLLNAYCVFSLNIRFSQDTKEENLIQTFLRLQEGTPLNKAEKINAYRGRFKDNFRQVRETHKIFGFLKGDKRFRLRQLSAEMLMIELEGDFENKIFPDLSLPNLIKTLKTYEKTIPPSKVKNYVTNLDYLYSSLNIILTAFTPREMIAFYLLVSYLRKNKAGNENLQNELAEFTKELFNILITFSIYDDDPPEGMTKKIFDAYKKYKTESKILTSGSSLRNRLNIMINEFDRMHKIVMKDPKRFHDIDQKRILYFRQKGLCTECGKEMIFDASSAHHGIAHKKGGKTDDLENAQLLHIKCHERLEKRIKKHSI